MSRRAISCLLKGWSVMRSAENYVREMFLFSGKPKNSKISKALQHENKNIQHVGYIPRLNVDKPYVKALD